MEKISLFSSSNNLFGLTRTWLYLDLDTIIVRPIDDFFPLNLKIIYCYEKLESTKKNIGNTSVYRFNVGSHEYLLKNLENSYKEIFKKIFKLPNIYKL